MRQSWRDDSSGIVVPKMVNARTSGIGFTVDPVTGDDSKIILEANWGLGEGVVSGAESVDGFVVNKEDLKIIKRQVGNKVKCVVRMEKGAEWAEVPENMRNMPCISDEEILEISRIAKDVEKNWGVLRIWNGLLISISPFPRTYSGCRHVRQRCRQKSSRPQQTGSLA